MLFDAETKCSKRTESTSRSGQKNEKRLGELSAFLLVALFVLVAGCSGKIDQKALIDVLNKSMNRDRIMLYMPLGRVGQACSDLKLESKPIPEQAVYADAQKAGLISITPDGAGFWKVELLNPSPQIADALKGTSHNTKDGCDSMWLRFSVAYKAVADVRNIRKVNDDQSEVEFTWKWTLAPFGTKFVSALSPQELVGLNDYLKNPALDDHRDPSFNIADMAQTGTLQSAKKSLSKYEINR
jgi:hypothetical protein